MKITGLNKDLYLIGNPVIIEGSDFSIGVTYLEITVINYNDALNPKTSTPLRIYPINGRFRYNLQEVIRGNFDAPKAPASSISLAAIETNYVNFEINITEKIEEFRIIMPPRGRTTRVQNGVRDGESLSYNKVFIRGWRKTMNTNITLEVGDILKETELIPRWGVFPVSKYYIEEDKRIYQNAIIPRTQAETLTVHGCDPLYIKFLNSKGGYSNWLFETFEEDMKHKSLDYTQSFGEYSHLGFTSQITLKAESRIPQRYFALISALVRSPEVYVYERYGVQWAKVILKDTSWSENNYETVQDFSINLEIVTNENSNILWS